MLKNNIATFIACDAVYQEASIVLFGAPYDSTTSFRPGTRFASETIRRDSYGLETYSPYQDKDLEETKIFDSGDLELPFGDSEQALWLIQSRTAKILNDHKIPFMIGGEHLVSLGSIRACYEQYPDMHIIHLDAHADLRENYLGVHYSHACVMRRAHDLLGDGRIHQFGIRSGDREEWAFAREKHTDFHPFGLGGLKELVEAIKEPVYLTLDLDVLDPSVFPGTGTPEPGGLSFLEVMQAIIMIASHVQVIGMDVNELCPIYDQSGVSTAIACKIIREALLALENKGDK